MSKLTWAVGFINDANKPGFSMKLLSLYKNDLKFVARVVTILRDNASVILTASSTMISVTYFLRVSE